MVYFVLCAIIVYLLVICKRYKKKLVSALELMTTLESIAVDHLEPKVLTDEIKMWLGENCSDHTVRGLYLSHGVPVPKEQRYFINDQLSAAIESRYKASKTEVKKLKNQIILDQEEREWEDE